MGKKGGNNRKKLSKNYIKILQKLYTLYYVVIYNYIYIYITYNKYFFILTLYIKTMFPRTEEYTFLDEEGPLNAQCNE